MKYIDINRKFTEAVNSYMMQGYTFNSSTMGGSQGEIASIDLTNGNQIIRILLDDFNEWEGNSPLEGLKLVIGTATDGTKPNDSQRRGTIWNNHLNVVSCEKFYRLSSVHDESEFYGTREDAVAAEKIRFERYCRRDCRVKKVLPQKYSPLVRSFIHREFGIKRVITDNISIVKCENVYTVIYNKHSARLY